MLAKLNCISFLYLISVILVLVMFSESAVKSKFKLINNRISGSGVANKIPLQAKSKGVNSSGRGFFRGGLLSFSKVLNFFPVGGEKECQPTGYNVARAGICINAYDCRQRDGKSAGDCASGLGVCCVFEITCGGRIQNNITYFMSPGFPELWGGDENCSISIDKSHAGIMQMRIDFVHFSIGQPNRTTGECDEDVLTIGEGQSKFTLCGQNHGQHIYYTFSSKNEAREDGELTTEMSTQLTIRMSGTDAPRIWLMRFVQLPLAHAAPHGCLQYFTGDNGTIRTFNYASNGRHLASQEYKACIRRNKNQCIVRYAPCDPRSFRIGFGDQTANAMVSTDFGPGSLGGPGSGFYGPDGSFQPGVSLYTNNDTVVEQMMKLNATQEIMDQDPMETLEDEIEGSGQEEPADVPQREEPGMFSKMWSYIWSWLSGQSARSLRFSPYAQHYREDDDEQYLYYGYGNYRAGNGYGRRRCKDRVTIPCENEYFVSGQYYGVGVCDPHHCGNTFCPSQESPECFVESSITPFAVSVHFGPPTFKRNPEENIGMCLRYSQMSCDS